MVYNKKSLDRVSELFQASRRHLVQVVMDEDVVTRGRAIQQTLRHKTMGRIWRFCLSAGLNDLEETLKNGRRTP